MNAQSLTADDIAGIEAAFRQACKTPQLRVKLLTPLPWKTRLRLRASAVSNHTGIWLCDHRMWRVAAFIWRVKP